MTGLYVWGIYLVASPQVQTESVQYTSHELSKVKKVQQNKDSYIDLSPLYLVYEIK
jgi:hypothetical protein